MNWFYLALISTTLWSITAFLDKYLVSRYFQKSGMVVLIFFSAVIGLLLLPIILIIKPNVFHIPLQDIFILIASGAVYVFAILPYYFVIRKEDASRAVPFFEAIPVFSYFLGLIFLHEQLTLVQIVASALIIFGAIGLTVDLNHKAKIVRWRTFLLMMLSVFLFSLNIFLFKFIELSSDFWTTGFWEYTGFALVALTMLLVKKYRTEIAEVLRINGKGILSVSIFNEIINIAAKIIFNYASLSAPLVLVWLVGSTQPLITLFLGMILTIFLPRIFAEDISRKTILQKFIFIVVILIGVFIINR